MHTRIDHRSWTNPTSILAAVVAIALMSGLAGCGLTGIAGSGEIVSREFDVADFERVEVSGAWEATIDSADETRVVVHIDDNLLEHVEVKVDDGELKVEISNGVKIRSGTMAVSIETPNLRRLEASGATTTVVNAIDVPAFELEASGASTVIAHGATAALDVEVSGASEVNLSDVDIAAAKVDVNGASSLDVTRAAAVEGDVNGASEVIVGRGATVGVNSSGVSDVNRR